MPYYRAPAERPRQPKRFLTAREVEDMAATGKTEIVHADDLVITDAARETAEDLGVRITKAEAPPAQNSRAALVQVAASPGVLPTATAQPAPAATRTSRSADPFVQALVDAVRANGRLAGAARKG